MKMHFFQLQYIVALGLLTTLSSVPSLWAAEPAVGAAPGQAVKSKDFDKNSAQAAIVQAVAFVATQEGLDRPVFVTVHEAEGGFVVGVYKLLGGEFGSVRAANTNDDRRIALIKVSGETVSALAMASDHVSPKNLLAHNSVVAALVAQAKSGFLSESFQMKAEPVGDRQASVLLLTFPLVTGGHTLIRVEPSGIKIIHGA